MQTERLGPYILLLLALVLLFTSPGEHSYQTGPTSEPAPSPPEPPIRETFQGAPQLSLFPRLGDFRPEDDEDRLPYWRTYREHLLKISGVVLTDQSSGNRAFSFRGIKGIDSIGHFTPLAVEPNRSYMLNLKLKAELEEQATAGIGLIEYREFLWLGEQYPESLHRQIFLSSQELLRLQKTDGWQEFQLPFQTGPKARMIHLIFFREGTADRAAVLVDDVRIEAID